jgi:hypothetical protein
MIVFEIILLYKPFVDLYEPSNLVKSGCIYLLNIILDVVDINKKVYLCSAFLSPASCDGRLGSKTNFE